MCSASDQCELVGITDHSNEVQLKAERSRILNPSKGQAKCMLFAS